MNKGNLKHIIASVIALCFEVPSMALEIHLSDSTHTAGLNEILVTVSTTRHLVNGNEYIVTNDMRERSGSVSELLNLIPEVKVNRINNSLSVENKNNVLMLVNGKRYSADYIKSINIDRVVRIKVIKNPTGRYVSEGYDAIIDLKIRDYDGFEFAASNFAIINFNNNEKDKVMMEQPSASFTFTQNKIAFFASYVYGASKWNTPYENMFLIQNGIYQKGIGLDKYKYYGNVANFGLNYCITDKHEISAELDWRNERYSSNISLTNKEAMTNQSITNKTTTPIYGFSLFYKGQIGNKANIYSEIAYNKLRNEGLNILTSKNKTIINEDRHDINYTLETDYHVSDLFSFKSGYQFGWKRYNASSEFDYYNTRNKLWVYLMYNQSEKFSSEIGCVAEVESIKQNKFDTRSSFCRFLPSLMLSYNPSNDIHLNLSYTTNGIYPTLAMLNPIQTSLHHNVFQKGNPNIKPSVAHKIALDNKFMKMFSINLQFDYIKNHLASLATWEQDNVIFSYKNTKLKRFSIPLLFDRALGKFFNLNVNGTYYISWGEYEKYKKRIDGWWYGANLTFFNKGYMIDLAYNRNIVKNNLIQGYEQTSIDSWTLTANKQWFGDRLTTMLTWFLPMDFGLSKQMRTKIATDFYNEHTIRSMKPYRNALIINLTYRFSSGKNKKSYKRSVIKTEERISGGLKL